MWLFSKRGIVIQCDSDDCKNKYESKEEYSEVEQKAIRLGWRYNFKADFCPECCKK